MRGHDAEEVGGSIPSWPTRKRRGQAPAPASVTAGYRKAHRAVRPQGPARLKHVAFTRITVDPKQMAGIPCIRGLRFPVATVMAMVVDGMTAAEILVEHPDLQAGDIVEALRFAALAVQERQLPLLLPT
jgi:uncharacterized protein (DUF433 family)